MCLVLSDFIAVVSNFSSLIFISLIFFLINIWSWHNLLFLFLLSHPFPKSCFFYFFFNACLILERKTGFLTAFPSFPTPLKIHVSYAFSCDHSMAAFYKVKPLCGLQWLPGHLQIPTLYCSPCPACSMAYSHSLSCFSVSDPGIQTLFFLSEHVVSLSVSLVLPLGSPVVSQGQAAVKWNFSYFFLKSLPSPTALSPAFYDMSKLSIRFDLSHFILFTLRLPLIIFA